MARFSPELDEWVKTSEAGLSPLKNPPDGNLDKSPFREVQDWCRRFSERVYERCESHPDFLQAGPIPLGSWARSELVPQSDLDIGFVGSESHRVRFVKDMQTLGLRIRPRELSKENVLSWPYLEQLVVLDIARASDSVHTESIYEIILSKKRQYVKAIWAERKARSFRAQQFENVLEPHLKMGLGSLRDILQARQVLSLFEGEAWAPQRNQAEKIFEYYRWFFLAIRLRLYFAGGGDFLQASLQPDLSGWFGFSDLKDFMREIHKGLSRCSFYGEWVINYALASRGKRAAIERLKWNSLSSMAKDLKKDSGILMLSQVRSRMDDLVRQTSPAISSDWQFKFFESIFLPKGDEKLLRGVFRSRLIDLLDKRLRKLVGYNQHDQYHAYTADTHILNILIELKLAFRQPRHFGRLGAIIKSCTPKDVQVLAWSCYYHDLGKGQSGDHERIGVEYVEQDARKFKRPSWWSREISWVVQHHLAFSKAAFRENPRDEATLKKLSEIELTSERIRRLILFTALDVRATHPKAWTPWKEKLLWDLFDSLMQPDRLESLESLPKIERVLGFQGIHLSLVEAVGRSILAKDAKVVKRQNTRFAAYAVKGGFWIRFFESEDRPGRLLFALQVLFSVGCSVRQALIAALPGLGIYDWFLVESEISAETLKKRLAVVVESPKVAIQSMRWKSVDWLSTSDQSWSLLFKGIDQRGLLLTTADKLFFLGAHIQSARAHTWGKQAEDIFEIGPIMSSSPDEFLEQVRKALT